IPEAYGTLHVVAIWIGGIPSKCDALADFRFAGAGSQVRNNRLLIDRLLFRGRVPSAHIKWHSHIASGGVRGPIRVPGSYKIRVWRARCHVRGVLVSGVESLEL